MIKKKKKEKGTSLHMLLMLKTGIINNFMLINLKF